MNIDLKVHNIILLVGPSNCGKTYFTKDFLIPSIIKQGDHITYQHISSDAIRQKLLGHDPLNPLSVATDKMDRKMDHVSVQAFNILETMVDACSSYPVNNDFIIVDSTGLSEKFRDNIIGIAKKNNYNLTAIIFDYKTKSDYFYNGMDEGNNHLTKQHLNKLKKQHKTITKKNYNDVYKIKDKNFGDIEFNFVDTDIKKNHYLPNIDSDYVIVSDIHGCYNDLITLLESNINIEINNGIIKSIPDGEKIIINGDIIDKYPSNIQQKQLINFVYNGMKDGFIYMVKGNHENFVYKYINKLIKQKDSELPLEYFNSIDLIINDKEIKERFEYIHDNSKYFYYSDNFIVTHSPVENKYLGKLDEKSLKKQMTFYLKRDKEMDKGNLLDSELAFIKDQAVFNNPHHFMGHVALKNIYSLGNKHFIDTGCSVGGKLSMAKINNNRNPFFVSVSSSVEAKEELVNLFDGARKEFYYDFDSLDPKVQGRIRFLAENKVNYISGTMSPSDKHDGNLESLYDGLSYYKSVGVDKVILQPKEMGSRANLYLRRNIEDSYIISRNGYKIRKEEILELVQPEIKRLHEKIFNVHSEDNLSILVLDCELMPWSIMGAGLIEDVQNTVLVGAKSELEALSEYGFADEINKVKNSDDYNQYLTEMNTVSRKDIIKKYGNRNEEKFKSVYYMSEFDIQQHLDSLAVYEEQMNIYGQPYDEENVKIKPFSILKAIYADGSEKIMSGEASNTDIYNIVSDTPDLALVVDLSELDDKYDEIKKYYDDLTLDKKYEGVVIKPETDGNNYLPYMKVRNNNYLTITYGYDYLTDLKYNKLLRSKSTKSKKRTSMKEYRLGKKMLNIPYSEISMDNQEYVQTCIQMINELDYEKTIDPRL